MVKNLFSLYFKLAFFMALMVTISNYLVQYPVNYFGLSEVLTYGAFSYPVTFLITDLANRSYGKQVARKIVYLGFFLGIALTVFFSTNFEDLISIRIAIGSGTAFLFAQLIDVQVFDKLREKIWFVATAKKISKIRKFSIIFQSVWNPANLILNRNDQK